MENNNTWMITISLVIQIDNGSMRALYFIEYCHKFAVIFQKERQEHMKIYMHLEVNINLYEWSHDLNLANHISK